MLHRDVGEFANRVAIEEFLEFLLGRTGHLCTRILFCKPVIHPFDRLQPDVQSFKRCVLIDAIRAVFVDELDDRVENLVACNLLFHLFSPLIV